MRTGVTVTIQLTPEQRDAIKAAAKAAGVPMTVFVRQTMAKAVGFADDSFDWNRGTRESAIRKALLDEDEVIYADCAAWMDAWHRASDGSIVMPSYFVRQGDAAVTRFTDLDAVVAAMQAIAPLNKWKIEAEYDEQD